MLRFEHRLGAVAVGLMLGVGAGPAGAEWVDWIADAEVASQYTDNLNRSPFESDEEYDFSWHPTASVGRTYQLTDLTRVSLTGEIKGDIYHRFDRLNAVEGGGQLAVFHKFGVGDAPWLRTFFFGGYKGVTEGDRSGRRFEVGLTGGKRFSPRFDASLTYRYTDRDGGNGPVAVAAIPTDVFDQTYHLVTLAGNFLLAEPLLFTAGYTFRAGDFDWACTPANIGRVLAKARVEALAFDSVFGGCVYRLDGTGHSGFVNFSYGITNRISLDAGYRFQYGEASSLSYIRNIVQLAILFRY